MEHMKGHYTAIRVKCEHIDDEAQRVVFRPVIGDSAENAKFFAATPGGIIDLQVVSAGARAGLDVGREYDVHFYARPAPVKMLVDAEWLSRKVEGDPDLDAEAMNKPRFFPSRIGRTE